MTEANGKPPTVEGPGRYHVFKAPDGGWVVARAVGICEKCQECGCGEQADPIQIPAMVIQLAMSQGKGKIMGMLKAVRSNNATAGLFRSSGGAGSRRPGKC